MLALTAFFFLKKHLFFQYSLLLLPPCGQLEEDSCLWNNMQLACHVLHFMDFYIWWSMKSMEMHYFSSRPIPPPDEYYRFISNVVMA